MAHFIGDSKPWNRGNAPGSGNGGAYDQMSSKWWSVYDKHQTDNSFSAAQQRYAASKQAEEGGSTYSATKFSGSTAVGGGNLPESTYSTQIHLVDPTGGVSCRVTPYDKPWLTNI